LLVSLISVLIFFHKQKVKRLDMEREIIEAQYKETMLQARLEIQEQTFNNVSREIHDNVGQLLSLAKVQVNIMDQSGDADKSMLHELKQNIGQALIDLRDIAKSLSGERMILLGLLPTLKQETDRINRSQFLSATLHVTGDERKLSEQKQLILVRIFQEILQNIIKHAEAKNVEVRLNFNDFELQLAVNDDGRGFDFNEKSNQVNGLGLQNIVSRAEIIGGHANIVSTKNMGTQIKIAVPYE
jgi:signal transduction histidine kinase